MEITKTILVGVTTLLTLITVNLLITNIKHQEAKERILYYYQCRELSGGLALKTIYQDSIDNVVLNWCGDGTK